MQGARRMRRGWAIGGGVLAIGVVILALLSSPIVRANTATYGPQPSVPLEPGGPFDRVYHPENQPDPADTRAFPHEWTTEYANAEHNAAFPASGDAPQWLRDGVTWQLPEARAWPLENDQPFARAVYGNKRALTTITQFYGNSLGVTAVDGVIYAESDDMFMYAINARTGKLIWRTSPIGNNLMGNPLVVGDFVYASAGSVSFNFHNVQQYAKTGDTVRGGSISYNGIVALDRHTGELKWFFATEGEAMPTPAIADGRLFISTGAGMAYAIDALTGRQIWKAQLGGIANMSSPAVANGKVYLAMSIKPYLYCLDAKTGRIDWRGTIPQAENTGMGDVSPAVANGIVVMDAVAARKKSGKQDTMTTIVRGYDANTGKVLWTHDMGRGPTPPAFKGGMPMIHDGIVYVGTPTNSIYQALDLKSGRLLWTWHVPDAGPAGAGRGAATYYDNTLYVSTGPSVYALDPKTGTLRGQKHIGGRLGIVNPVIVGGTMYLANSWDWITALPLSDITGKVARANDR